MNTMVKELGLGNLGEVFYSENPEDWVMRGNEMRAIKRGKRVAEILFSNDHVHVTVNDAYDLVRPQHQSDFNPHEYGIRIETRHTIFGDKMAPDLQASWKLPENLPVHGERVYTPPTPYKKQPRCKGALSQ